MTDTIQMKKLTMTAEDYRAAAVESIESAVAILRDESQDWGRTGRLKSAAELIRASDTFEKRAAVMENFGFDPDTVEVEEPF